MMGSGFSDWLYGYLDLLNEYWEPLIWWDGTVYSGLVVTLWLLLISISIGFMISLPLSLCRVSKRKCLRWPVAFFTYVFRGTPFFVQLLLIYGVLVQLDWIQVRPEWVRFFNGYHSLLIALVLNTMAYTIEMFAGYIQTIPIQEIEAARAFGMSKKTMYRHLILPSMLRRAVPAYSNEVILMLHSTSLASVVTVPDILKVTRDMYVETYQPFTTFGTAAVMYMLISFVLVYLFKLIEKRALCFMPVNVIK